MSEPRSVRRTCPECRGTGRAVPPSTGTGTGKCFTCRGECEVDIHVAVPLDITDPAWDGRPAPTPAAAG